MSTLDVLGLVALGAIHGINPAMGWLFAVALGLQERSARAVWRALPPLALGHAVAIAAMLALALAIGTVIPSHVLRTIVGVTLIGFGVRRLFRRHAHARGIGMRVTTPQLTAWSFLMASAHGAGLMVPPLVMPEGSRTAAPEALASDVAATAQHAGHTAFIGTDVATNAELAQHAEHAAIIDTDVATSAALAQHADHAALIGGDVAAAIGATALHAAGYLLVTGLLAVIVYHRLGLRMLRSAWINLDVLWAVALVGTGVLSLML